LVIIIFFHNANIINFRFFFFSLQEFWFGMGLSWADQEKQRMYEEVDGHEVQEERLLDADVLDERLHIGGSAAVAQPGSSFFLSFVFSFRSSY
jgi:hypothetical protein